MNIVVLNDFAYVDGGASKVALGSATALAGRGHRVNLFTAVGPVDQSLQGIDNLALHCLGQQEILKDPNRARAVVQGLWNRRSGLAFQRLLQGFSPRDTVVHLHTWTKALSASPVQAARALGFRVVVTLHDYFSVCPTGSFYIHPTKTLCPLRPMSAECISTQCDARSYGHKLWRVSRCFVQERAGGIPARLDHFITISDKSEELLRPYLPLQAQMHRVENPIEIEQLPPVDPAAYERFCYVGRLSPEKGADLLARCAAAGNLKVVFAGDGGERDTLAGIAPTAEFTGWVPHKTVRSLMRTSRALVFPSQWYETQGMVVAEAAALGLPAVVPSESAARQWVEDGVTGLCFQHGSSEDLGRKLLWLKDHPEAAAAMGGSAYGRYWKQPCTMEKHCNDLESVYSQMLQVP